MSETNLERAIDAVRDKTGHRTAGYSGGPFAYRNLLERDDVDAVLIATPAPLHARMAIDALKAGKDVGSEVPVLRDFVNMVKEDREPWIDVYDAATWSARDHSSQASREQGSVPVPHPDFTRGKWKDPGWRKGSPQTGVNRDRIMTWNGRVPSRGPARFVQQARRYSAQGATACSSVTAPMWRASQ